TPEGKPIKLSDFKGKVVILDFWATWCGPCKVSMPGLQKIYDQVRDQGVVVLSLNVWDEKDPFDAWIKANSGTTYNFTFAFDVAGRGAESIATSKFNVSGIPTMYIINRDGKVAKTLMGSGNEANIVKALGEIGIKAKAE
ncbi:MAG TPA: TlpA disulfide reductase family protein, partial [Phycisphaerae bacterium]|nr:TlpA disulfide reductase family protein [Phycisphaerae bacterium]